MPQPDDTPPALRLETLPLESLQLDPSNARRHDLANLNAIARSLERFGQQKPVVVDARLRVLAGNGTVVAARQLGWTTIQAARTSLTGDAADAYALADNRSAELAAWDADQLGQTLARLAESATIDRADTGFSPAAARRLIREAGDAAHADADVDNLPTLRQVLIECETEDQQKQLYDRLRAEGLRCRVLSF